MPTIADSLQNAAQAVTDQGTAYQLAAATLNNEIGAVASNAGLDPTQDIGTRLLRAIRSARLTYVEDTSTEVGVIKVTPALAHKGFVPGLPLAIRLNQDIAGATRLNLGALAQVPVRHSGGGELQKLDYKAGDIIEVKMNANVTAFTVTTPVSGFVIDEPTIKTVHGAGADFVDLNAAFTWLNRRRIAMAGSVLFQLPVGVNASRITYAVNIAYTHPDGARVSIVGQPLSGALPAGASLSFSAKTAQGRATDTATNLTLLRNFYATEISFVGGASFLGTGSLGNIQDILFTSDGAGTADNILWQGGSLKLTRIASMGAGNRGICPASTYLALAGANYAIGCAGHGVSSEVAAAIVLLPGATLNALANGAAGIIADASTIRGSSGLATLYARGNGADGVAAVNGGSVRAAAASVARDNANNGFSAGVNGSISAVGTTASGNTIAGYAESNGGVIDAQNTSGANDTFGYYGINAGFIARTGGTCTGGTANISPASSPGNNGAYIS